ncbi:MAG: prepilin-type N-terminal cleavage/methylation domain-containing protein [Candidatus Krumholzibacteriota bacterium]|nr:prepilin-type N-terminal cleavage/methylation domain-containing protein [Candidatus Krumholzibacteriota bacterium]
MNKKDGFTLTELMVAISIFGLVLAIGTPPVVQLLRHYQTKDAASIVMGVLRKARSKAIQEKNNFIVLFDTQNSSITIIDDDGGANGNPSLPGFSPTSRGNGRQDNGERIYGPYDLPRGQVFGMVAGTVDTDGDYVTRPVTFSGTPPRVIFYSNGSTNEEGLIFVMPELEFREQERGTDQMMIVRRSTGSVILQRPTYN